MYGGKIGLPELAVVLFVLFLISLWGQIFHKAGYSRWLVLLVAIPLVNVFVIIWFAFSKWPVEIELERLRSNAGSPTR